MAQGVDVGSFVGSNFDGDKAIAKILTTEKKKKVPLENYKFVYEMQKDAWLGLKRKLADLNTASRNLYSPLYSPFRKIKTSSTNNNVLEALQDKVDPAKMVAGKYSVIPKQVASADHFRSDAYSLNEKLPAMNFNISNNGKDTPITFTGGTLQDLSNIINTACGSFLTATTAEVGNGLYVMDIEGKNIGKKNAIEFTGNTDPLKKIGLLKNAEPTYDNINITQNAGLTSNKEISEILLQNKVVLQVKDFVNKEFSLPKQIKDQSELWVYLSYTPSKKDEKKSENQKQKEMKKELDKALNQKIGGFIDKIWVGDADLYGEPLLDSLPNPDDSKDDNENPNTPNPNNPLGANTTLNISLNYQSGGSTIKTTFKDNHTSLQIVKIPLNTGVLSSIKIENTSDFSVQIEKAEIVTLNKGKLEPKNSISKAQNAIVNYKGIDYEREKNTINDVIPGTTLNVKGVSKNPIDIDVNWDYDAILERIKEFVVAYNNTMDYIKNVAKNDINDLGMGMDYMAKIKEQKAKYEKMTDKEKDEKGLDGSLFMGMLSGDSTIGLVKDKIQRLTTAPYKTDAREKVMFLSQLGIKRPSISEVNTASEEDQANFRAGYLEFTKEGEDSFMSLLKQYYTPVRQLFYTKSIEGKPTFDKGLAIEMNGTIEQMVANNYRSSDGRAVAGLIKTKTDILDTRIKRQDKDIKDFDQHLGQEEQKLRSDFGKVYSAQEQSKGISQQLQNLGK